VDPLPDEAGEWSTSLSSQLGPALSQTLRTCLRDIDISTVAKPYEILVLMPHTDREGALIVGNRMCKAVSSQSYHFGRLQIQPSVSVGGACLHGEGSTADDFITKAKANMMRAVDAGGGRTFIR
jgi:diguanylate cyclase (GGDEF)-like protein